MTDAEKHQKAGKLRLMNTDEWPWIMARVNKSLERLEKLQALALAAKKMIASLPTKDESINEWRNKRGVKNDSIIKELADLADEQGEKS